MANACRKRRALCGRRVRHRASQTGNGRRHGRADATGDALSAMNRSIGLTDRRYGARAPDAGSVEAIASRHIDRMGLMAPEEAAPLPAAATGAVSAGIATQPLPRWLDPDRVSSGIEARRAARKQGANAAASSGQRQQAKGGNPFADFLDENQKKARIDKLMKALSRLPAKVSKDVAQSLHPKQSTAYLDYLSGKR